MHENPYQAPAHDGASPRAGRWKVSAHEIAAMFFTLVALLSISIGVVTIALAVVVPSPRIMALKLLLCAAMGAFGNFYMAYWIRRRGASRRRPGT